MPSMPPGFSTIGPIYEAEPTKTKFIEACKKEKKTMERKLKDLIHGFVKEHFPDYVFPEEGVPEVSKSDGS